MKSNLEKNTEELSVTGECLADFLQLSSQKGVPFKFRAKGDSMAPFIKDQAVITIIPYLDADPDIGDIAAFIHPQFNTVYVHRIIRKKNGHYLFKGDNNLSDDEFIDRSSITGFVRQIHVFSRICIRHRSRWNKIIAWLSKTGLLYLFLKYARQLKKSIITIS